MLPIVTLLLGFVKAITGIWFVYMVKDIPSLFGILGMYLLTMYTRLHYVVGVAIG